MNSTSRGCRLVSRAARSPARWITGPEVARKPTPISRATICANVVLPSPGGPNNSTWSSASPRALAASIKTARLSRNWRWPTNSANISGRSDASAASCSTRSGATMRDPASLTTRQLSCGALLQCRADQRIDAGATAEPVHRHRHGGKGFGAAPLKIDQRRDRIGSRAAFGDGCRYRPGGLGRRGREPADLVLELVDDARGKPGTNPVGARQHRAILGENGEAEIFGHHRRQDRKSEPCAYSLDRHQQPEPVAFSRVDETVEVDMVLADMRLDQQPHR